MNVRLSDFSLKAFAARGMDRFFADQDSVVQLDTLLGTTCLDRDIAEFHNRSVVILADRQLLAALAILELQGVARRITLIPAGFEPMQLASIIGECAEELLLTDSELPLEMRSAKSARVSHIRRAEQGYFKGDVNTEWLLLTSGTSGKPKLVRHTLETLSGAMDVSATAAAGPVWGTFYDIRRYGGLQIYLRALLGGGSLVFFNPREPAGMFLMCAAERGVSHISGTPSHWRSLLMSGQATTLKPAYIRLSGEIADQAILDALHTCYPDAQISHAFASTEAGVVFDVADGMAGFPAEWIENTPGAVELRVRDGSLHVRSPRIGLGYVAGGAMKMVDGFVDTGDIIELRNGRYLFSGRKEGIINVGGNKVHPEEVEAVVNLHPCVQMSRVQARPNPITGAIVVANVVLNLNAAEREANFGQIKLEILKNCVERLAPYKVPVLLYQVPLLDVAPSGKLWRHRA